MVKSRASAAASTPQKVSPQPVVSIALDDLCRKGPSILALDQQAAVGAQRDEGGLGVMDRFAQRLRFDVIGNDEAAPTHQLLGPRPKGRGVEKRRRSLPLRGVEDERRRVEREIALQQDDVAFAEVLQRRFRLRAA